MKDPAPKESGAARLVSAIERSGRRSMTSDGILPDFIVIGAMKAGTTTLYEYLARHPEIGMSRMKETDFFVQEKNWPRGVAWYRSQFQPGRRIYGEVSPNYSMAAVFQGVPARVHATVPGCRLIYIARDPVLRAISQYHHLWHAWQPNLPSPDALAGTTAWRHLIDPSLYYHQILKFLKFKKDDQILVLDFEDFIENPAPTLNEVAQFLGVTDQWPQPDRRLFNATDEYKRLPAWYWRQRERGAVGALRRFLPHSARQRLRRLLQVARARPAMEFGPLLRECLAEQTADDAKKFRALTGRAFPRWSV